MQNTDISLRNQMLYQVFVRNYRTVDPAQGTMETFQNLVDQIHKRGMKCIIDCVYNHTSPDAVLLEEHPEYLFFHVDSKGICAIQ